MIRGFQFQFKENFVVYRISFVGQVSHAFV